MQQGFIDIDSILRAFVLLHLSILLAVLSLINCCKKKKKKTKATKSEEKVLKGDEKSPEAAKADTTPKKWPGLEANFAAKLEKKLDDLKKFNLPTKNDQQPCKTKEKKAQPPEAGNENETTSSSKDDFLQLPVGTNIGHFTIEKSLGAGQFI
jgi:hypothetical protein